MFEDWQILKSEFDEHVDEYAEVAAWCNENGGYTIVDDGEYYKVVKIEQGGA